MYESPPEDFGGLCSNFNQRSFRSETTESLRSKTGQENIRLNKAFFFFCHQGCFFNDRGVCGFRGVFRAFIAIAIVCAGFLMFFLVQILITLFVVVVIIILIGIILPAAVFVVHAFMIRTDKAGWGHHIFYISGPGIAVILVDVFVPVRAPIVVAVVPADMPVIGIDIKPIIIFDASADQDAFADGDGDFHQDLLVAEFLIAGDGKSRGQVENAVGLANRKFNPVGYLTCFCSAAAPADLDQLEVKAGVFAFQDPYPDRGQQEAVFVQAIEGAVFAKVDIGPPVGVIVPVNGFGGTDDQLVVTGLGQGDALFDMLTGAEITHDHTSQ